MAPPGQVVGQASFGGGMFRGRRAPRDAVYDALNGLVDDERLLYRRGGAALLSVSDAAEGLIGVGSLDLAGGHRDFGWGTADFYPLDGSGDPVAISDGIGAIRPGARPAVLGGLAYFPGAGKELGVYGGTLKTASYLDGTVSGTEGETAIVGAGTLWLANVDPGMIFTSGVTETAYAAVERVVDDTHIELAVPLPETLGAGTPYVIKHGDVLATPGDLPDTGENYVVSLFQRLWVANGRRVAISEMDRPIFPTGTYHDLGVGASLTGAGVLGRLVVLFTTEGVWAIANGDLDVLDDFGNVQQSVEKLNGDVILWGDAGIAAWAGGLLVPAVDDVHVLSQSGGSVPVSAAIRPLYQDYVQAGYTPGLAAVHRGHYWLPVMDGTSLVDVLVCRLDLTDARGASRPAWTRWSGQAASPAYVQRVGVSSRQPALLGVSAARISDLSGCMVPSALNKQDVDGVAHELQVVSRDLESGEIPHTFTGARVALELAATDNPTFEVEYASGPVESEVWTSAGVRGESDGESPETFRFAKRARTLRLRVTTSGPCARAVLRSVEAFFRPRGRV